MKRIIAIVLALIVGGAALVAPASPASAARLRVCAWQVPPGYVKVHDEWSPTSCGNPPTWQLNVWHVESYIDKPVGTWMRVCAGWRPAGWVTVSYDWDPGSCGHPSMIHDNIWIIERVA